MALIEKSCLKKAYASGILSIGIAYRLKIRAVRFL
jgi:hypothetical protein